ncbi:hypothetical protein EHS25_002290 [Saitozyma podzolica]|uniref:Uncharacterized protein n=1 Tax=Saitozyma podzolica TaxID=1890683 RepID=A0A427YDL8_9TREE|nr:hypothetical protein EHS25_002290 [Saitozyma podzolica]
MGILGRFTRRKAAPPQSTSPSLEEKPSLSDDAPDANADDLPHGDGRVEIARGIDAIDVMADRIFRSCSARGWFGADESKFDNDDDTDEVVTGPFEEAVGALNPRVAIKMRSKAVQIAVKNHIAASPDLKELFINANTRIQILATTGDLCLARKSQYAAFVRTEGVLVVWADRVEDIVATASALEESLVDFIWSDEADLLNRNRNPFSPVSPGFDRSKEKFDSLPSEGDGSSASVSVDCEDPEKEVIIAARKLRPVALIAPAATGLAAALAVVVLSLGVRALIIRYLYDKNAVRFALAAVLPPSFLMIMFPSLVVVFSLLHLFGPVAQYHQNSATYSAVAPVRDPSLPLLPITVQLPVYKESLEDVIMPTLESVQRATTVFERQGGAVNVIVCDDGLQLLDEEYRARRIKFYTDHNVGYVARPPHGVDGFERRGRFKKAGNLNHCNALSLRVEDIMDEMRVGAEIATGQGPEYWTELDERELYDTAFARALEEADSKTWAQGNIRIGEIILLIDSDTRVPEDCFMDASMEMSQSPHVAIIQHASGVMQVAHHFFENGVAFFTRNLQVNISFTASSGTACK